MTAADFVGYVILAFALGGSGWALVDLLAKIRKQPKRPLDMLRLTSYPFVPDDETLEAIRQEPTEGLRLQPVPIKVDR